MASSKENMTSAPILSATLDLTAEIIRREVATLGIRGGGRYAYCWLPEYRDTFIEPIILDTVQLTADPKEVSDFVVESAVLTIEGDDETSMEFNRKMDESMFADQYAAHFYARFYKSYSRHAHDLCIRSLRRRRQIELDHEKFLAIRRLTHPSFNRAAKG